MLPCVMRSSEEKKKTPMKCSCHILILTIYCPAESEVLRHGLAKVDEVYRFRDVVAEARSSAFILNV